MKFKVGDKVVKSSLVKDCGWGYTPQYKEFLNGVEGFVYSISGDQHEEEPYRILIEGVGSFLANEGSLQAACTQDDEASYTGSSSDYYKVFVKNPTTLDLPYQAECNDIIEALEMTFAEGNAFKAIWRKAKARQGVQKKGYDNGLYDSEKVVFFGQRMVVEAQNTEDQ